MKKYTLLLKGTQKRKTEDIEIEMRATTRRQAFNFAYMFFETGEYGSTTNVAGKWDVKDFIPDAEKYEHLRGKYKVFRTSVFQSTIE